MDSKQSSWFAESRCEKVKTSLTGRFRLNESIWPRTLAGFFFDGPVAQWLEQGTQ